MTDINFHLGIHAILIMATLVLVVITGKLMEGIVLMLALIKVSGKAHMLQRWDESEPQGIYMRTNHILSCLMDTTALRQAFISCTTTLCGVLNTDVRY